MKINEVIVEALNPPGITVPAMADMIRRKCQPYLSQVGWDVKLFRSIHPKTTVFSINDCPVNRKPVDTPIYLHHIVDNWMLSEFGVKYRSNAVFVTGSGSQAMSYGERYVVYPVGGFNFCWSPKIYDMTKQLKPEWQKVLNDYDGGTERIKEVLVQADYQNTDLLDAISSRHEIMIHCQEYIMVDLEWDGVIVKYIRDEDTRNTIK